MCGKVYVEGATVKHPEYGYGSVSEASTPSGSLDRSDLAWVTRISHIYIYLLAFLVFL